MLRVPPATLTYDGIPDLCPELPEGGIAQRLMEAPGVGSIYEHGIRPLLTRLVGGPRYRDESAWLDRWLEPLDGLILDLACGTGRYTRSLAARFGDERLVGADVSWPMLRRARQQSPELHFVRASAQALPFEDASLGGACTMGALHLFPDPIGALSELGRVLRPGAPLVILTAAAPTGRAVAAGLTGIGRAIRLRFLAESDLDSGLAAGHLTLLDSRQHGAMRLLAAQRSGVPA